MVVFPNQPSEITVRLLNRRANTPIEDITTSVRFITINEKLRKYGTGRMEILAEDLTSESNNAIISGNAAIQIIREWEEVRPDGENQSYTDTFSGPITIAKLKDGDFISQKIDFTNVKNEIVVLGSGTGSSRGLTRVNNTASQTNIGCRELVIDARDATTSAERTAKGNAIIVETLEAHRQIDAGGRSRGQLVWELLFADHKVYLAWRHVDAAGVASVDPGNVAAGNYIRSLINDNLLLPGSASHGNFARRQIEAPAVIGTYSGIGNNIDIPVRWTNLAQSIQLACALGDVGVTSTINTSNQIEYNISAFNDRTSGTTNGVIWNRDNVEATWNVQVGDKITVEEYLKSTSTNAEIEPADHVCVGRSLFMVRGQQDIIKLQIGSDQLGIMENVKQQLQTTTASQFV